MFESAEIGHAIDKETYDAEVPALREALLEAQFELKQQSRFPVIVLINGIEGAGKGETVKLLNEWMDPRLIEVRTFDQQTDEELARPPAWRYWRALPSKGRMGVFFGNWYSQMLQGRVHGQFKDAVLDQAINGAERLEKMLCDEGALIIKFWFHLSKKQMKARLKALKEDPLHNWRISPLDWQQSQTYDRFVRFGERVLRRTSRDYAPWHIIEGVDPNYRSLAVGKILLEGLQNALKAKALGRQTNIAPLGESIDGRSLLGSLDMTLRLDKNDYQEQLHDAGVVVVKFWLSIDEQTQLERFQEREQIPFKRFKITEEDWRNRDKWDAYSEAVGDMVDRTSTEVAPWTLVEANDKRWARVKVLRTINEALEAAFKKDKK